MADVTPELMFGILRSTQALLAQVGGKVDELKQEMQALRSSQNGVRQEITGVFQEIASIHATLVRHEGRLDRIERRLEIQDVPTLQNPPSLSPPGINRERNMARARRNLVGEVVKRHCHLKSAFSIGRAKPSKAR